MLVISPLTSLFKIICLALAFFTILLRQVEKAPRNPGEYLALVLLATVGLMLLVGSEELLMIFIGLELLGLSLYVMAAFDKTDVRSAEAGLKYFLFGSTSSAFTLFGISLIYGMTGTTGLAQIGAKLATTPVKSLPRPFIYGRLTPIKGRLFRARHSSLQVRRLRRSLCWEKSCSLGSRRCMAAPDGMRWWPVGRLCWRHWQRYQL